MAVYRVIKDKDNPYVTLNKYYIYDNRLSWKAKGIMSYFLSRPDNWEFYVEEMKQHSVDKETAITTGIKELINAGYIKRTAKRNENGKFKGGYDYEIYETPLDVASQETTSDIEKIPKLENPESVKSRTGEIPNWENQRLLNNDSLLNNECSYREDLQNIINYYCSKALITELQLKPLEIKSIIKIIEDRIPVGIIKQGIDIAFEKFKPSFEGDKIKTFKYCVPVIKNLQAKQKAKKEGAKDGADIKNIGKELEEQGIGL